MTPRAAPNRLSPSQIFTSGVTQRSAERSAPLISSGAERSDWPMTNPPTSWPVIPLICLPRVASSEWIFYPHACVVVAITEVLG